MKCTLRMTIAALALATPAAGQGVVAPQAVPTQAALEKQLVERARVSVESRITTGAPYSADTVTESVQVLSDGNRIARKTPTRIYRDSEGRTRREQLSATTGEVQSVSISDPVAGAMYVLNPAAKTAQKSSVMMAGGRGGFAAAGVPAGSEVRVARVADGTVSEAEMARRREVEADAASASVAVARVGEGGRGRGSAPATGTVAYPAEAVSLPREVAPSGYAGGGGTVNKEELGTQVVEGLVATGTRTTTTIATGSIGNDRPILDRIRAVVFARPQGSRHDETQRPAKRRNHLSPDQRRPGRAVAIALRSAGRLHVEGFGHPASVSDAAARLAAPSERARPRWTSPHRGRSVHIPAKISASENCP